MMYMHVLHALNLMYGPKHETCYTKGNTNQRGTELWNFWNEENAFRGKLLALKNQDLLITL